MAAAENAIAGPTKGQAIRSTPRRRPGASRNAIRSRASALSATCRRPRNAAYCEVALRVIARSEAVMLSLSRCGRSHAEVEAIATMEYYN